MLFLSTYCNYQQIQNWCDMFLNLMSKLHCVELLICWTTGVWGGAIHIFCDCLVRNYCQLYTPVYFCTIFNDFICIVLCYCLSFSFYWQLWQQIWYRLSPHFHMVYHVVPIHRPIGYYSGYIKIDWLIDWSIDRYSLLSYSLSSISQGCYRDQGAKGPGVGARPSPKCDSVANY